jgi:hypothetical protein
MEKPGASGSLLGGNQHRWPIDGAFKAIQAFNLAVRLSEEERKLKE